MPRNIKELFFNNIHNSHKYCIIINSMGETTLLQLIGCQALGFSKVFCLVKNGESLGLVRYFW